MLALFRQSLPNIGSRVRVVLIDEKVYPRFLEKLPYSGHPITERDIRAHTTAEFLLCFQLRQTSAAGQHSCGIIRFFHSAAGKNKVSTEELQLLVAPRHKNFKPALGFFPRTMIVEALLGTATSLMLATLHRRCRARDGFHGRIADMNMGAGGRPCHSASESNEGYPGLT